MATTNKIFVGIDDQVIELTGADKEAFIAQREADNAERLLLEAEAEAKKQARIDAITKLGQASGLTTEEIESILNI
jgi:tRNA1(Val) A37 N6-methylase TrmN6